jgi:hypothetical protein
VGECLRSLQLYSTSRRSHDGHWLRRSLVMTFLLPAPGQRGLQLVDGPLGSGWNAGRDQIFADLLQVFDGEEGDWQSRNAVEGRMPQIVLILGEVSRLELCLLFLEDRIERVPSLPGAIP